MEYEESLYMDSTDKVQELITLVSLFTDVGDDPTPARVRHIRKNRLSEIVSSLNLKSILYSPLTTVPYSRTMRRATLSIRNDVLLGTIPPLKVVESSFDLALRSLSHMWSVCGHRYLDAEQTITPCPTYCGMIDSTGKYVISGADDSLVKIWEVSTGKLLATLSGHTAEICDIAFSYDSEYIASLCTEDNSVIVWKRLENHLYIFQRKLSEIDPNDVSRRLSPLYMSFTPDEAPSNSSSYLKLVIAYTNSTVIIYEIAHDEILDFNRVKPYYDNVELKSFAVVACDSQDTVRFLIGVNRPTSGSIKSVLNYSARSRGVPKVEEFKFPSSSKSSIVHIAVANSSRSFIAADDEISTVVLYRELPDNDSTNFSAPQILFRSFVSGDATLGYDQSSLLTRLREFCPSHPIASALRISTDIAIFTINDEFILCTIAGHPRDSDTLGQDDSSSIYCCLVFVSETCQLVGVIGLGKNRDNLFNIAPIKPPVSDHCSVSYFAIGGHDGLFSVYKIFSSAGGSCLIVENLTEFQIDERGSNRPRMILDCSISERSDGEILALITDAKGTITMFSSLNRIEKSLVPSEQFFHNDYVRTGQPLPLGTVAAGLEVGSTRTTTAENGGVVCDTRLVPLAQLQSPSPDHIPHQEGSGFVSRFNTPPPDNIQSYRIPTKVAIPSTGQLEEPPAVQPVIPSSERRQLRPAISETERERRAESLRNLAAARAAQTTGDSPEYVRTASGRVVRSMNNRPIHENEFELYENSEIDDSDFSDMDDDDSDHHRSRSRRRARRSRNDSSSPVARRGRPPRSEDPADLAVVPLRMDAKSYVDRIRAIQAGSTISSRETVVCTLCGDSQSDLLGPFRIADIGDSFFHDECLFTLTNLRLVPQVSTRVTWNSNLTFANLERLVTVAKREGKCFVCKSMGAGIKCCRCRRVVHYKCSRQSALERDSPLLLDPALDGFFICHTCELPSEAQELRIFSLRPKWRRESPVRDWLVSRTNRANILKGVFVPQIGDLIYYYPPKIPPGESSLATTVCTPGGYDSFQALTDLAFLSWFNNPHGYIAGRVEKIEYKFPSFFDVEQWGLFQVLTIVVTGVSNDVNTFEGLKFKVHYRPKKNGSDFIVPQLRVNRFLLSGFERRARSGDEIAITIEEEDGRGFSTNTETIHQVTPDTIRPGWECFRTKSPDDGSLYAVSLWELDLPNVDLNDPIGLVPGISQVKARFMSQWLSVLITGNPIHNSRNRIDLDAGSDIFAYPPWLTPGVEAYAEYIEFPMYMTLIKDRLDGGYYRHLDEVRKDVGLISMNCENFNDPNSIYVPKAQTLVSTLIKLLDLSEADHSLCLPPRVAVTNPASESVNAIRIRTTATSRTSIDTGAAEVNSVTVNRNRTLTCSYCGAKRVVDLEKYNRFKGKTVKCRWIKYGCDGVEESPTRASTRGRSTTSQAPQVSGRPKRKKRVLRGRHSDDASSLTESSDTFMSESSSDSISDSESESSSGHSTPRATRRSSRTSPNKRYRRG